MCVCIGRKHRWVSTAFSGHDASGSEELLADNSMKDGYRFPCCQLIVPKVCCMLSAKSVKSWIKIKYAKHHILTSVTGPLFDSWVTVHWSWSWPDKTSTYQNHKNMSQGSCLKCLKHHHLSNALQIKFYISMSILYMYVYMCAYIHIYVRVCVSLCVWVCPCTRSLKGNISYRFD